VIAAATGPLHSPTEISLSRAEEVGAKLQATRSLLHANGWSAAVLQSQSGFAWITAGGRSHISIGESDGVASAVVTPEDAFVVTTNIEGRRLIDEEIHDLPFETVEYPWHEPDARIETLGRLFDISAGVSDSASGPPLAFAPGLHELRYVMLTPEQDRYRILGKDSANAVESACLFAEPGDTEADVAARVAYECTAVDVLPLVVLVAADVRIGSYRHPLPTERRVHGTLLVALTGRRHGLHASLTRMVSFGAPDDELARRHEAVTDVDARVIDASKPGTSLAHGMQIVMDAYAVHGFPGEWKRHHQGGLTGYAGREIFATPIAPHRIRTGEALAWNPSITRVKSEDTILVGDSGCEVLTRTTRWPQQKVPLHPVVIERPALLVR
jgi:Xaa-Pro aminopeptidase